MVGINVPIPVPTAYYSFGGWKSLAVQRHHAHGTEGVNFFTRARSSQPGGAMPATAASASASPEQLGVQNKLSIESIQRIHPMTVTHAGGCWRPGPRTPVIAEGRGPTSSTASTSLHSGRRRLRSSR